MKWQVCASRAAPTRPDAEAGPVAGEMITRITNATAENLSRLADEFRNPLNQQRPLPVRRLAARCHALLTGEYDNGLRILDPATPIPRSAARLQSAYRTEGPARSLLTLGCRRDSWGVPVPATIRRRHARDTGQGKDVTLDQ